MLGDLFKIFVEEPEKLTKVGLRVINTLFLLIVAEWLYRQFFGPYSLMNLTDYKDWVGFILNGGLLVTIACFLIARYFIEPIPALILYLIVVKFLCPMKLFKIDKSDIPGYLQFFDILKIDKGNKIPRPGKNIDILYKIAGSFKNEEDVEGYNELKYSLLNNVLNLYAFFVLVYFFFLKQHFYNKVFIWILIAGFVSIILLYVIVNNLIEFMQKEHEEILTGLDVIKNHHLVYDTLEKLYIRPYKADTRVGKEEFFEFDGKSYALIFDYSKRLLRPDDFLKYLTKLNKQGRHLFLITDKKIDARDFSKLHNFEHLCTIISYENYTDLKSHLNDKLVRKLMKEQ